MSRKQPLPVLLKTAFFLAVGFTFCGCASKPSPTPPAFNLYGYQRVLVVPFDNQTNDPALAKDAQEEIASQIVDLNAVPVIEAAQVAAYLKSIKADPSAVASDPELRMKLGAKFKGDLLLIGTATGYSEFLKDTAPERLVSESTGQPQWGFYTKRKVVVNANAKLLDAATGSLVWNHKAQGYSWYNTWNPLPIPGGIQVPDELHQFADLANLVKNRIEGKNDYEPASIDQSNPSTPLYKRSQHFAKLRENALFETVKEMVGDFKGYGGWSPSLRGN